MGKNILNKSLPLEKLSQSFRGTSQTTMEHDAETSRGLQGKVMIKEITALSSCVEQLPDLSSLHEWKELFYFQKDACGLNLFSGLHQQSSARSRLGCMQNTRRTREERCTSDKPINY